MDLRQLFLRHLAPTTTSPLALEFNRAEGIYLYAPDGTSYMDFISGIGVSNIGHSHPEVVRAVKDQAERYMHLMVYGEYVQQPQVAYARDLCSQLDPSLDCVYWGNSGAEAIEGAMKLAKRYTKRTEFISCYNAYHGATQGALSLAGDENFKNSFRPLLPDIQHINHGNLLDLHINGEGIDISNYINHEEWELSNYYSEKNIEYYSCCLEPYPDIKFYYIITRRSGYYDLNIVLPTFATASLILLTLLVPWSSGERISFAVTVMLSIIVFLLILSDNLPKSDQKPLLSRMIIGLTLFSLIGVFFTILISALSDYNDKFNKNEKTYT